LNAPEVTPSQIVTGLAFLLILAASGTIWAWVASRRNRGLVALAFEPREPIAWHPGVLAVSLSWIGLQVAGGLLGLISEMVSPAPAAPPPDPTAEASAVGVLLSAVISLTIWGVVLAALWWQSPTHRLADYGITFRRLPQQVVVGTLGSLASAIPVLVAALMVAPFRTEKTQHVLLQFIRGEADVVAIAAVAFIAVVAAPLMEELIFRVVLQGWLTTTLPERQALPIAAGIFAAVHGWPDAIPLFPLALILGMVYHRTHRYFTVVVLHAIFNATNLAFALLAPESSP
jgi:membrane protease YdiL (CAAX protease family)